MSICNDKQAIETLKKDFPKLNFDLTSEQYHKTEGTYSSSQLKKMLEDPEIFYRKYISKTEAKEEGSQFDVGTYFHTRVLEPEKLSEETAVYPGKVRRGKEWDAFKEANVGKAILTADEVSTAERLAELVMQSPVAQEKLDNSLVEVSTFLDVYVFNEEVYAIENTDCYMLTSVGWELQEDMTPEVLQEFGVKLTLKARSDILKLSAGEISDLKSTTGNCKNPHQMKMSISKYSYDLSAALYLDLFTFNSGILLDKFNWIFASKDIYNTKTWVASERSIKIGRMKWRKAVIEIANYLKKDWQFTDELGVLEPQFFENEWLTEDTAQA